METYKELAEFAFNKLTKEEQIELLNDWVNDFPTNTIFREIIDPYDLDDYVRDNIDDFIN